MALISQDFHQLPLNTTLLEGGSISSCLSLNFLYVINIFPCLTKYLVSTLLILLKLDLREPLKIVKLPNLIGFFPFPSHKNCAQWLALLIKSSSFPHSLLLHACIMIVFVLKITPYEPSSLASLLQLTLGRSTELSFQPLLWLQAPLASSTPSFPILHHHFRNDLLKTKVVQVTVPTRNLPFSSLLSG